MGEDKPGDALRILRSGLLVAGATGIVLVALMAGILSQGFSSVFRDAATAAISTTSWTSENGGSFPPSC